MAGGKETPRQKLIGMMYLVLLALLALQVSNAVIEKFFFINVSLERAAKALLEENEGLLEAIEKQVAKRADDDKAAQEALAGAEEVHAKTAEVILYLNELKELFIEKTGGYAEGRPKGMSQEDFIDAHMIGKKNADVLMEKVNTWAKEVSEISGIEYKALILKPGEMEEFENDPQQKRKTYAEFAFAHTPMVAGLAQLTQYENEILHYEYEALNKLAEAVDANQLKFDKTVAMVLPEAKTVAAGGTYSARMLVAASSSGMTPKYFLNGDSLKTDEDGYGIVNFKVAPAGSYEDGRARKTFIAKIEYSGKEIIDTIEYFVAEPSVLFNSAEVSALYLNCANPLTISAPSLGSSYDPRITAAGADVVNRGGKGEVIVVPKRPGSVTIDVASGTTPLTSKEFRVRRIPKPEIILKERSASGKALDLRTGVRKLPDVLYVHAEPDPEFARFSSKDARFLVAQWDVIVARGTSVLARKSVTGPTLDLRPYQRAATAGSRLIIDVKEVRRANFRDQTETMNMAETIVLTVN